MSKNTYDPNYNFGLDADLAAKREATYDKSLEDTTRQWVEGIVGEKVEGDFFEGIRNGIYLCKLGNKIKPGSCKSTVSKMPFVLMENINSFLNFCKSLGVATTDLFMTVDLWELQNKNQVIQTLQAVKRITSGSKPAGRTAPSQPTTSTQFCGNCGNKATPGANFCGSCGNKI
ncbi:hypothetical protein CYY_009799 [Polysphondylium violaceum]|uniref:Calponin-homology (CH) domain-containing protein n=1 Tax=Polysphondylium violaceum TaxID=133409 RepID=A0A8J4UVI3_9MYCE|nr:hypothetical protein CYY_009799 [Polysphondylium violaceum]